MEGTVFKIALAVLFLPLTLFAQTIETDITQTCFGRTVERPWPFCLTKPKVRQSPDILYFIHGANDNEKTWFEDYRDIRDAWRARGKAMPTVISFTFAPVWLTVFKNGYKTSGLLQWIPEQMMPWLEAQVGGLGQGGHRMILSKSMGGFNATQFAFHYPKLFSRVAMISPAILQHTPFDLKALPEFIKRTGATKTKAFWTSVLFRSFFPTAEVWAKTAPYYAGADQLNAKTPELYISAGDKDTWGFFEGAKHFAERAKANGVRKVVWDLIPGGTHHEYDADSVAEFLEP